VQKQALGRTEGPKIRFLEIHKTGQKACFSAKKKGFDCDLEFA